MAFIIRLSRREGGESLTGLRGQDWHTTGSEKGTQMKKMLILGIAVAMAATSAFAAYPTLAGMSGNGVLPTAAVASAGQWNVALDYYNSKKASIGAATADAKASYPIRVLYGVMDGLEVGAGYTMWKIADQDANTWNINAKYALPFDGLAGFALAAGARYGSTDIKAAGVKANITDLYLVGTRAFDLSGFALDTTIGVNWEKQGGDLDQDGLRLFLGLGTTLANKLSLAAEFQTKNSDLDSKSLFDVVARYPFTDMISGEIGYGNYFNNGFVGNGKSNFFTYRWRAG